MHPGLCASCIFMREVRTGKGSRFYLCGRAKTDPRFALYPPIPVLVCPGYEARGRDPGAPEPPGGPGGPEREEDR